MNKFATAFLAVVVCLALAEACSPPARQGLETGAGGTSSGGGDSTGSGAAGAGSGSAGTIGSGSAGTIGSAGSGPGTAGTGAAGAGSGSAGTTGTGGAAAGPGAAGSPGIPDMIDDLEDNNGRILMANGRQGPWHVFNDQSGGNQVPAYGGTFAPQSGGPTTRSTPFTRPGAATRTVGSASISTTPPTSRSRPRARGTTRAPTPASPSGRRGTATCASSSRRRRSSPPTAAARARRRRAAGTFTARASCRGS